jgi:hypothetical protein
VGYDASCTIRFEGKTAQGKASLETTDLIFRGPFRLVIPLKDVTAVAVDGWLSLTFGGRIAELHLESAATKWAHRISHPPSRLQKLGVKPDMLVIVLGVADTAFLGDIRSQGARVSKTSALRAADLVFYGAERRNALTRLRALSGRIKPNGAIWVIRPKGNPGITEADVMSAGKRAGLVDVKVVSFSPTHTAEKFVIPVAKR